MTSMKKVKIIIITLAILILCGLLELLNFAITGPMMKAITAGDLVGKYETQLPERGKETLNLLADNKCEQVIQLQNGATYTAMGQWRFDKLGSSDYICFNNIRSSLSEFGDKINPNIAEIEKDLSILLPIERTLMGNIKIGLYEDQGIYYRKIN